MRIPSVATVFAAVLALFASGCASQMAIVSGSAKKSVTVNGSYDTVFLAASEAGKDLGFKINEKKAKNLIVAQRGMGYGEYSTVMVRFSEAGGTVTADFDANSNKGSAKVLEEYLAAFDKKSRR